MEERAIEQILDQLDLIINEVQEIKSRMLRLLHSNFDNDNIGIGINHADNDSGSLSSDNESDHHNGPNDYYISENSNSEDTGSEGSDNSYDPEEQSDSESN